MAIKRCPADAAFSTALRMSRGNVCEHCYRSDAKMECAHVYGRREKTLRWCADNALCLCHGCHRYFTENPLDFNEWLNLRFGPDHLDGLNRKRRGIFKATKAARAEIAKHYREQIRLMEAGPHELVSYQ